jgi:hypothetical protein
LVIAAFATMDMMEGNRDNAIEHNVRIFGMESIFEQFGEVFPQPKRYRG